MLEPERMDDPSLDPGMHDAALNGLARLNTLSLAHRSVLKPVLETARRINESQSRPARVLDVATGSGDVALGVARGLARAGVSTEFTLTDVSTRALARAGERFAAAGIRTEAVPFDIYAGSAPEADIVICTLFLHHVESSSLAPVLRTLGAAARERLVVSDLRRTSAGLVLARVFSRLMTRSPVVHTDAVLSARAAFTVGELSAAARESGLSGAQVTPAFPSRMLLTWDRQP